MSTKQGVAKQQQQAAAAAVTDAVIDAV